ncbi:hypothetical protein [Paracoccus sp. SSJ]|uniref:hypothetical protein n=1 Tax=Paracoccus sp. SSJ TaxID=3050636 RepID=UPI00254E2456|nr:hypothetical protein [Paracoccus sp. SSJ]MDK8871303.1 hypothetical protein [Paracoccus sp. SSJ]
MNDQFLRLSRRIALAVLCMLPAPLLAEAPLVPVSDHAGQVVRQDLVPGAYEIVHASELGLVFVASSPALDDGSMGAVYALDHEDLRLVRRIELPDRAFALAMDLSSRGRAVRPDVYGRPFRCKQYFGGLGG